MKDLINRKDDLVANCATQPYYLKVRTGQGSSVTSRHMPHVTCVSVTQCHTCDMCMPLTAPHLATLWQCDALAQ